jgi:hypothetical protein
VKPDQLFTYEYFRPDEDGFISQIEWTIKTDGKTIPNNLLTLLVGICQLDVIGGKRSSGMGQIDKVQISKFELWDREIPEHEWKHQAVYLPVATYLPV